MRDLFVSGNDCWGQKRPQGNKVVISSTTFMKQELYNIIYSLFPWLFLCKMFINQKRIAPVISALGYPQTPPEISRKPEEIQETSKHF